MAVSSPPRRMPSHLKATYLGDQETLIEETRATRWHFFPGPVVWTFLFGLLTYLTFGSGRGWPTVSAYSQALADLANGLHIDPSTLTNWLSLVVLVLFLLGLGWVFVRYLRWVSTVYAVTSHRVIVQRGILGRTFDEIPVTQVRGVDVHQSFGQRLLRYGTLRVSSEGGSRLGNEDWVGIPQPFVFQRRLENAAENLNPVATRP